MSASTFAPDTFTVRFEKDGTALVSWPEPGEDDPDATVEIALRSDSLGASVLAEMFRGVLLGRR